MKEARTMRDLHHPNVVSMIGVVLVDHPLYILLEYVSGGVFLVISNDMSASKRMYLVLGYYRTSAGNNYYLLIAKVLNKDTVE